MGTLRDISFGFGHSKSIRQITEAAFYGEMNEFVEHLQRLLSPDPEKGSILKGDELEVATERALVKPLLERHCEEQWAFGGNKASFCQKLVRLNILRPTGETWFSGNYEFHSFLTEVCVRALLGKPFVKLNPTIPSDVVLESHGRGSEDVINFLISARRERFEENQQEVLKLLNGK